MSALVAVGECMVEIAPAEGGLHRLGYAGDTFNAAWAARLLLPAARPVRYMTAIGTDWVSDALHGFMAAAGLDLAHVRRDPARAPGLYAIRLDGGERSFAYWRANSAATRLADDPAALRAALAGAAVVLFSGITVAILPEAGRTNLHAALGAARAAGTTVAFDPNYRPRLWRDADEARAAIARFAAVSSCVLPSFSDEAALFGDADPAATASRFAAAGCGEIVVKDGPYPVLCRTAAGDARVSPVPVGRVVDTTGAGDAFNGAYLAARLEGAAPADAAARGNLVARVAIGTRGALIPRDIARILAGQAGEDGG